MYSSPASPVRSHPPRDFQSLSHCIVRQARFSFRHLPAVERDEAVAEAVAAAFASLVRLQARGLDPARDFPSAMARFAVHHVRSGRHVGGPASSTDVLSPQAQHRHGFRVSPLPAAALSGLTNYRDPQPAAVDAFVDCLHDNTQTPVPDQVAFRIDFPAFLRTLSRRDRRLARFLALGHSARQAAARFALSPARVTQLRRQWQQLWQAFHGEIPVSSPPRPQACAS